MLRLLPDERDSMGQQPLSEQGVTMHTLRPVFTHRPPGPGPRAANFQGRHIKKIEIEVWYAEKKGCPRERNLREIYTENNVGTEFSRYDATGARRS